MQRGTWLCVAVALSLVACQGPTRDQLEVGVIISLTGSYGALGSERLQGVALAFEEINAAGGVLGQDLVMDQRDDQTDPVKAKEIATEMVEQLKLPAIIGAAASASTLAVSEVTVPNQVLQISGSSTSPAISALADDGFVNRTCPSDALQGRLIAQRAYQKGLRRLAIVHAPNAYGVGLADASEAAFQMMGGTVTAKTLVPDGTMDMAAVLDGLYANNPDAILMVLYTFEGIRMIQQYSSSYSAKGTFWFFPDSVAEQDFITGVGSNLFTFQHEGTGPGIPAGPRAEAFAAAYSARYGKEPESTSFAANFYDAAYLLALSIEAAGGVNNRLALRDAIAAVSSGGTEYGPKEFTTAVEAIREGTDVDYSGVSGPVDLNASGDPVAPYAVWKVVSGVLTVVEPNVNPE